MPENTPSTDQAAKIRQLTSVERREYQMSDTHELTTDLAMTILELSVADARQALEDLERQPRPWDTFTSILHRLLRWRVKVG